MGPHPPANQTIVRIYQLSMGATYIAHLILLNFIIIITKLNLWVKFLSSFGQIKRISKMTAFWDIVPCSLVVDRSFRGLYYFHHHRPEV
jgi:hypothetical protein